MSQRYLMAVLLVLVAVGSYMLFEKELPHTSKEHENTDFTQQQEKKSTSLVGEIMETASGLKYRILERGEGASPLLDSQVRVHYRGRLEDGKEFDSSYQRGQPATFPVNGVIRGWTEALLLMKPGDRWELTLPAKLGYGSRGVGDAIPPNSTLIFEVELLEIL